MRKHLNEGRLLGDVTNGPFEHETKSGKLVARFTVTTESERGGETYLQHHNVTTWEDDARWVMENVLKGQCVYVSGEMRTRTYPDENGDRKQSFEVVALPIKHGGIIIVCDE